MKEVYPQDYADYADSAGAQISRKYGCLVELVFNLRNLRIDVLFIFRDK